MKKIHNLVIGGIQSKIFNLILYTVVLLTCAYMALSIYHTNMLTRLTADSSRQQQESISSITGEVMNAVVVQSLDRTNRTDAAIADAMLTAAAQRVAFLADRAAQVFSDPGAYAPKPYSGPDLSAEGTWAMKVIHADGVDAADAELSAKIGLLANLSDTMISLCSAYGADTLYLGLPEGVHMSVSTDSNSWFVDGKIRSYDPRTRGWYQKAEAEGRLIFTDGEWDATTGGYCIECAMPVYGPDGTLVAVAGTDMYLDDMLSVLKNDAPEGEFFLLVTGEGRPVLEPGAGLFPIGAEEYDTDLRNSQYPLLSKAVSEALEGKTIPVEVENLLNGRYYITASPIAATGWVLISAFEESIAAQPIALLENSNARIQEQAVSVYREKTGHSRNTAIVLLLAVMVLTLGGALVLGARIVKPLNTMTKRISELSEGNLEFRMENAFRTGDEVEELAQCFASISHKTVEYLETVRRVTAEKERIGAELSLATDIQAAMLPHIFPPFPSRGEFDIFASMNPAKEVGGDFYDYFLIDNDHLAMVIADVSGKGVPAALFMMASKILLQSTAKMSLSPSEILRRANDAICSNNEAQMFVTVWLSILEISTGRLTAANAGHEYPVLKKPDGNFELYKDRHGFVIGGMEDIRYREYELQLEPGSKLFVYTDGVPEATNEHNELFGTDRMLEALNEDPAASPQNILWNVHAAVNRFVRNAEQFDDLTMLCIEYKGPVTKGGTES